MKKNIRQIPNWGEGEPKTPFKMFISIIYCIFNLLPGGGGKSLPSKFNFLSVHACIFQKNVCYEKKESEKCWVGCSLMLRACPTHPAINNNYFFCVNLQ